MNVANYWILGLKNIPEFDELSKTEDTELDLVKAEVENILKDQFIQTATEEGISIREEMIDIHPYSEDTLEQRRFRLASQWNIPAPYSYRGIEAKLIESVGTEGYEITIDYDDYTILIEISLGQKKQLEEMAILLNKMVPANMVLTVILRYNRNEDIAFFTHEELSAKTHEEIRSSLLN